MIIKKIDVSKLKEFGKVFSTNNVKITINE